ncbi:MAG: hypothetical protein A2521_01155 [Deltaproteobacteria bacterium RIFOXYD12_FULL_57_12]|nr:MAG: hypothetical protein A2521_01155 [Deltaproteobacteria bacterium RIFOXYD12_FULL_57_12]
MIDLHCHILAGLDDGPEDVADSVRMARIAAADGIKIIVATPHIRERLTPPGLIYGQVAALNARLADEGVAVTVVAGGEVFAMLDPALLGGYTIQGSRYLLVEFPYTHLPKNAGEILFRFVEQGFWPIISHPERNPSVLRDPELLASLLNDNISAQITADSLAGNFGAQIQACSCHLLRQGLVSFLASDGHSPESRRPVLSTALKIARKILGREKADRLVQDNPAAVLADAPLEQ